MKHVLFVCTGNTCRSPMAEALFRELIKGRDDFEVSSGGLGAFCGQPASKPTTDLLRARGLDVSHHQSRPVTGEMVRAATHIFAMSHHHVHSLEFEFPEAADKLYLISEFCPDDALRGADVNDPFGAGRKAYQQTLEQLEKMLPCVLAYIDQTWKPANSATDPSFSAPDTMRTDPSNSTPPQQVAIAADHGGVDLKNAVVEHLRSSGHLVEDFGTHTGESVDYPDYAAVVSRQILAGAADAGILVCTSGIGMAIAANRFPGIQASLVADPETAVTTREHNASNVLCLAGKSTSAEQAKAIVDAWLRTPFAGGRHGRRVEKMNQNVQRHPLDILEESDPAVAAIIRSEQQRQQEHIELIASENFTSKAVMAAQGSCLTNKYAEGYPAKRWYGGCEEVDKVEQLAIDRVCQLFGARFANVQPHSGSQANTAVYFSVLEPGDRILTMNLAHGGHLTHGNKANFSGRFYEVVHYGVSQADERIDYDELQKMAEECKPKMITAGASAYPRIIDFERMGRIAKSVGAYLFVDMAHIAGLVAGGMHPNPMEHADFVTSTTHKSLRGPRGGIILTNSEELAKKINSQVFPGVQGGPLMHVIAAKAVCFGECLRPGFADYSRQVVKNAQALAARLAELGYRIVSGGTDNHLMLVDLRPRGLNGKVASETLDLAGITVNKNGIPFDTEKITLGGGIRIGTPAVTTRGMKEAEMVQIANWIDQALTNRDNPSALAAIKAEVAKVNEGFPLP